jgi:hypothetical protein
MKIAVFGLTSLFAASIACAQPYDLSWYTIDGGGGTSTGGSFSLSGTIGQPDAGTLSGGTFTLSGGFWVDGSGTPSGCDSIDFNNDGLTPDTLDIEDFIAVMQGSPCSNDPNCGDIDFNNDGLFPDTLDVESLLSVFSGGPCL